MKIRQIQNSRYCQSCWDIAIASPDKQLVQPLISDSEVARDAIENDYVYVFQLRREL